ncbi:zinc ABC transporter substrate-binding protein [Gordonia jinhuaensis]|uniref:ABC transporter substrate-binding protein n=2 Tax=Gordonia jinhuaensis TaxID=1517702 RepID=A0A916T6A1_9ACTN|nr:ABC transporter substrate-binding protein [Gordonia jinhuaensis]
MMGLLVVLVAAVAVVAGCDASSGGSSRDADGKIVAVATTNVWGSILSQLGGDKVSTSSIISNPNTDPHDYEPSPADSRLIASASVVVQNGIGYDSWAAKSIAANPNSNREVITVGDVVGVADGGNPHQWYSPDSVTKTAAAITAALKKADPDQSDYFDSRLSEFDGTDLAEYHQLIDEIRREYANTPIGASESVVTPLAQALGLDLRTPSGFLSAISEGADPTAADKATVDRQISDREIKVYVFNSQNSTPDVQAQVDMAKSEGIPVVSVTETLSPANATFQSWQVAQLRALRDALASATRR